LTYFQASHRNSYNFVFAGILLILYESLIYFSIGSGGLKQVNAVDTWLDQFLNLIPYGHWLIGGILLLLTGYYLYKDHQEEKPFQPEVMAAMLGEAFLWALVIYFNLNFLLLQIPGLEQLLPGSQSITMQAGAETAGRPSFLHAIALSLGAGFYEEFFFRLLLVLLFRGLFKLVDTGLGQTGNNVIIVLATAALFSLAHHISEPFQLYVFLYRMAFGLIMSLLLVLRGFGIIAWTHALYDVLIDINRYVLS
jgi:membrane protease YdiL (CAAX protease family)